MNLFDAKRIVDAVYRESNPDKSKTLQGWQKRAQVVRSAILQLKREHKEAAAEFYEKYLPKVANEMSQELWGHADEVINERVNELRADLREILDGKREQFNKVGLSAPSDEQLRLLQTAALRDDLTEGEVSRMGAAMSSNFQAMRALRSIAKKSGLEMVAPPSVEDFEASLTQAEELCTNMLNFIKDEELGYFARCFYDYDNAGQAKTLFDRLDNCLYAAVQVQEEPEAQEEAADEG